MMEIPTMKTRLGLVTSILFAVALLAGPLTSQTPAPKNGTGAAGQDRAADATAIKAAGQSFLKAFMAGDARALAAHWTAEGEYIAEDGTAIRGRAEIEKAYAKRFGKKAAVTTARMEHTSLRFPSQDTAIEEGHFRIQTDKDTSITSKYSLLLVREGGKWLMAVVREWPHAGASLQDLEWLIGSWVAKRDNTEVRTTYEWWGAKRFIRVQISLKQGDHVLTGFQMIGKDGSTGQIRSWAFDTDGNFGEATWTRDGKKWVQDSAGVLADGGVLSATNLLIPIDDDTFTFQSVERSISGEEAADIPPVRVIRVKSK
jgi:uncharacterized protein (TIGR02246 family)